jgi:hypothetical protein
MGSYASRRAENSRKLKPQLNMRRRRVARACLLSLYRYSFKRSILRANFERYQQAQRLTIFGKGLEGLSRFVHYNRYVNDLKSRSYQFMYLTKARKVFFSLDRNRIMSNYTKTVS